jgi:hypothetical protein
MKEYQEQYDFFLWDMIIQQSKVQIAFYPVVFGYIIGDNEGHDKLVGRFLNRMNVQRLCRYCDTPNEQSDNPFYSKWKHTHASEISNLVSEGEVDCLKDMSYHCFQNGFTGIKFADPIRGINGATPAERLHLFNHGLFQLILEYNFGQKRAKVVKKSIGKMLREVDKENPDEDDDDTENMEQSDKEEDETTDDSEQVFGINDIQTCSNIALFTPSICDQFDRDAKEKKNFETTINVLSLHPTWVVDPDAALLREQLSASQSGFRSCLRCCFLFRRRVFVLSGGFHLRYCSIMIHVPFRCLFSFLHVRIIRVANLTHAFIKFGFSAMILS